MGDILLASNPLVAISHSNERTVVRFSSPTTRNPLSVEVLELLESIISQCESNDTQRELVFTGTDDVFASGANLKEIVKLTQESAFAFGMRGQLLMNRISNMKMRTIAAINGYCYGGALDLALACDRRIASSTAMFCHPGVSLGIITGWGGTQRLPRLVGETNAMEMLMTGEPIDVIEALRIGLIDEIDNFHF